MFLTPHVIAGIETIDETTIDFLKYKLSGLINHYEDAYAVEITVSDLKLECISQRAIEFFGTVDEIIKEMKSIYNELDFKPYFVGFDFIGKEKENSKFVN